MLTVAGGAASYFFTFINGKGLNMKINNIRYILALLFAFSSLLAMAQEKNQTTAQKSLNEKNLMTPDNQLSGDQRAATLAPDKATVEVYPAEDEFQSLKTPASCNLEEIHKNLVYPEEGYRARIEGRVIVRVLVDKEGYPVKALIQKSDNKIFELNSINAVMNSRYTPAVDMNDNPVSSWISIPINFKIK
jgi:TonB family protein